MNSFFSSWATQWCRARCHSTSSVWMNKTHNPCDCSDFSEGITWENTHTCSHMRARTHTHIHTPSMLSLGTNTSLLQVNWFENICLQCPFVGPFILGRECPSWTQWPQGTISLLSLWQLCGGVFSPTVPYILILSFSLFPFKACFLWLLCSQDHHGL